MTTFTNDDVGKAVETADGDSLGVVTAVDRETAYVEPDPGIADSIRATLGWESASDDAVPIADTAVREIRDDAIRVAETVPDEAISAGDESGQRAAADERRDVESSRGDPVDPLGSETDAEIGERNAGAREGESDTAETEPDVDDPESGVRGADRRPEADSADDVAEAGADAAEEIDGDAERRDADDRPSVEEMDPVGEMDGPDEMASVEEMDGHQETDPIDERAGEPADQIDGADADAEELDAVEREARRDLEVDPTELADRDPEIEVRPEEDVGNRTDARVEPDDMRENAAGPTSEDAATLDDDEPAERERRGDEEES